MLITLFGEEPENGPVGPEAVLREQPFQKFTFTPN